MFKGNRPAGREKRIGQGTGSVGRRGSGLEGKTGGPVGEQGGYEDRGSSGQVRSTETRSTGGFGGLFSGGRVPLGGGIGTTSSSRQAPGGCSRSLIGLIVLIAVAAFFVYGMMNEGSLGIFDSESSSSESNPLQSSGISNGHVDSGEYSASESVSNLARDKRTVLRGNGRDTVTVMVYMCASDLEAQSGMATSDLQEMLYSELSDKVNVIVETGGTTKWQNNVMNSRTNQRYRVTGEGLETLEANLGRKSMVSPATLSDFIKYCKANYPADRNILILWDHGGGSLSGFGYDLNYGRDSMTLDEIGEALMRARCTFDIIGFDACLMATLETAIVLEPYSDYMIASEEVEPGIGWYYTDWLTALSEDTSMSTVEVGKRIIDDYVRDVRQKSPQSQATLSLIDLAELKGTVPKALASFAESASQLIDKNQYKAVSDARAGTKEFARSSNINQIDLIHFAENIGTMEAEGLALALRGCIKYNRTSRNISNANGISVFFPYGRLDRLNSMLEVYEDIGIGDEYTKCIRSFASVTAGGQVTSYGSGNMMQTLLGSLGSNAQSAPAAGPSLSDLVSQLLSQFLAAGDFSGITGLAGGDLGWLDTDKMTSSLSYYAANRIDASLLRISRKSGKRVLELPQAQWDMVQTLEMNVFIDDGEGFIDLGLDNVFEFNADGDLLMEYDGTWLALNGNIVSYYMVADDRGGQEYSIRGRVPALLNGRHVDIIVTFDNQAPYGTVLGAQPVYDPEDETETVAKGLLEIVAGDSIDFLCDYYTYDGEYIDSYYLGEQYTATGEWEVENLSVGDSPYLMTYRITDIYDNKYWTPAVAD